MARAAGCQLLAGLEDGHHRNPFENHHLLWKANGRYDG
jgi:hypothetical protein